MTKTLADIFDELKDDLYNTMNAPGPAHDTARAIIDEYKRRYAPERKPAKKAKGKRESKNESQSKTKED